MAGKPRHDYAAICADYQSGMAQGEVAAKHSTTKATVCRAVSRLMPAGLRERRQRERLLEGAALKSRTAQAAKIDRGEFVIERDGALVRVTAGGFAFIFDVNDEPLLRRFAWRATRDGRLLRQVRDGGRVRNIYVYHDILDVAPSRALVVDHINRDPTDNRRSNLRLCTYSENALNRGPRIHAPDNSRGEERDCAHQ